MFTPKPLFWPLLIIHSCWRGRILEIFFQRTTNLASSIFCSFPFIFSSVVFFFPTYFSASERYHTLSYLLYLYLSHFILDPHAHRFFSWSLLEESLSKTTTTAILWDTVLYKTYSIPITVTRTYIPSTATANINICIIQHCKFLCIVKNVQKTNFHPINLTPESAQN